MPVIKTKENMVVAYEAGPEDHFVKVVWHGPSDDEGRTRAFEGPVEPIDQYQATVDWAVSMADQMRFPLHVVPLTAKAAINTDEVRRRIATLTDQERGELRRLAVARLAEVMRDCDDPGVRADAYDLLLDMKVVSP